MEEKPKYKYDKFEHFKNKLFDGLKFAKNLDDNFKNAFKEDMGQYLKPEILPKQSNYFVDKEKFSFTEFKNEILESVKVNFDKEGNKDNITKVVNYIKMININQSKEFVVFGSSRFDRDIRNEEIKIKYDFNYFKKNISLPDFLNNYGFRIDKKESSKNCIKMRNESTGDVFVIRKNSKDNFIIWDPLNDVFKGSTIIDFVLEKHKNDFPDRPFTFRDVSKLLTDYMEGKTFISLEKSEYKLVSEKDSKQKFAKEYNNLTPFTNRNFLKNRGIEDFIIDSEIFKDKIYNHSFKDEKGNTHINTAFPLIGENGVVAISKRNEGFKGMMGEKENGIFITKDVSINDKIDKIFLVESAIDAISHYQINYNELKDEKIRYISTEGSFSEQQIDLISKVINKQNPDSISFGQDNDLEGTHQITKILSELNISDKYKINNEEKTIIEIKSFKSKTDCWAEITYINEPVTLKELQDKSDFKTRMENQKIKDDANNLRGEEMQNVLNYFNNANESLKDVSNEGFPFDNSISFDSKNNIAVARIKFNNHHLNWEKVNQFIIENKFKNYNLNFTRETPLTKDFNDDLKAIKGIHQNLKINFDENKKPVLEKTNKEIKLFSKLKGEHAGEFKKVYIGYDKNRQLYKCYNIDLTDINKSDWKPITNEEHNKLSDTLYEEIIKCPNKENTKMNFDENSLKI